MNPEIDQTLIDHIVSSYGLIEGKPSDIAKDLSSKFSIVKETTDFQEVLEFLSQLENEPNRFVIFEHTPTWSTMLSNSKKTNSFMDLQELISKDLKRKNISVSDVIYDESTELIFNMMNEEYETLRSVKYIQNQNGVIFIDLGEEFKQLKFKKETFSSEDLSELVKAATKYDLTLDEVTHPKFILLEQN